MPRQPTEMRLNDITTCLAVAANTLEILAGTMETPFLQTMCNTTQSLVKSIQVLLHDECVRSLKLNVSY
jgi:hypothetical protein